MIYGIGTDIVNVARIERALERYGERFPQRILADVEMAEYAKAAHPARFLAKRFAAKEAYSKAYGTGIGQEFGWHDIHIGHDPQGRPVIEHAPKFAETLAGKNLLTTHISLSDETDAALAFVIIERNP